MIGPLPTSKKAVSAASVSAVPDEASSWSTTSFCAPSGASQVIEGEVWQTARDSGQLSHGAGMFRPAAIP